MTLSSLNKNLKRHGDLLSTFEGQPRAIEMGCLGSLLDNPDQLTIIDQDTVNFKLRALSQNWLEGLLSED